MRNRLIALAGAILLASAGAAFAQSRQGGYLGLDPGANVVVSHGIGATTGSGQGGYLGKNPGADVPAGPVDTSNNNDDGGHHSHR